MILVWLLLAILAYGLTAGGGVGWFQGPDGPLSSLTSVYLPLLGGPYAAMIGAKAVVGTRVENGSMAKPAPKGAGRRPLHDLISNDGGRTDLVDLQYVALSAVTVLYVVAFFVTDVGGGLPKLPEQMWALTGAPAGAYLVNKMATRANPVITQVTVADGRLLVGGGGFGSDPRVELDSVPLPAMRTSVDTSGATLTAALPIPPCGRLHRGGEQRQGAAQRPLPARGDLGRGAPGPGARGGAQPSFARKSSISGAISARCVSSAKCPAPSKTCTSASGTSCW